MKHYKKIFMFGVLISLGATSYASVSVAKDVPVTGDWVNHSPSFDTTAIAVRNAVFKGFDQKPPKHYMLSMKKNDSYLVLRTRSITPEHFNPNPVCDFKFKMRDGKVSSTGISLYPGYTCDIDGNQNITIDSHRH